MAITAATLQTKIEAMGIEKHAQDIKSAEGHVKGFGSTLSSMASGAAGAVGSVVSGLGQIGLAASGLGAVGGVLQSFTKDAADLEQAVANISTIKPEIDTSGVFDALNQMQTRVPQTAAQLGESLYDIFSSMDVGQAEALQLVETFAKGATGASTSASTFGTAVMGVMNAYKMEASDATKVSDIFFNTVNKGVISGEELATSLGPVTQSAKAAGVSIEELGGFIAGVTKEGGPAAQNVNNLNNFFQKISTKEAQKEIENLGVKTKTAAGDFRPVTDVLTDLKPKLEGMTESARANALQAIFPDSQARIGAMTLLSQLDMVKGAIEDNKNSTGSAASAYEKMMGTFNNQTALMMNTMKAGMVEVGAVLLPALEPLVGFLADKLPGAFSFVAEHLGKFIELISNLAKYFSEAANGGDALNDWLTHLPDGIQPAAQAISEIINVIKGLFDLFATGDVGSVTNPLQQMFSPETTQEIIQTALEIRDAVMDAFNGVRDFLQENSGEIKSIIMGAWEGYKEFVSTVWEGVFEVVGSFIDYLQERWPAIKETLTEVFNEVVPVVQRVVEDIQTAFSTVVDYVREKWPQIKETATEILDALGEAFRGIAQEIGPTLDAIVSHVERIVQEIGERWSQIEAVIGPIIEGAVQVIKIGFDTISNIVQLVMNVIQGDWSGAWENIKNIVSNAWQLIQTIMQTGAEAGRAILQLAWGLLKDIAQAAWDAVKNVIEAAWNGIKSAISNGINEAVTLVQGMGARIQGAVSNFGSLLVDAGRQIMVGLGNGIRNAFGDTVGAALSWVTEQIPIKKPIATDHLLLEPAGQKIMWGLGRAIITHYHREVEPALEEVTEAIANSGATASEMAASSWADNLSAMAGATANIRAQQTALKEWENNLRLAKLALHDLTVGTEAYAKQQEAIKIHTAEISARKERIALLKEEATAYDQITTALQGFRAAGNAREELGIGAGISQAFTKALLEDTEQAGRALEAALQKTLDQAKKLAIPGWEAMGQEIRDLLYAALANPSAENIDAVRNGLEVLNSMVHDAQQQAKEQSALMGTLTGESYGINLANAMRSDGLRDQVGSAGAGILEALDVAFTQGGEKNVAKVGELAAKMSAKLAELPEFLRGKLGAEFDSAMRDYIEAPTDAARERLVGILARINQGFEVIPKGLEQIHGPTRAAVDQLIAMWDSGSLGAEEATNRIKEVQKLIPKSMEDLLPATQAAINTLVQQYITGQIGIEAAIKGIEAATEAGKKAAKALADEAKAILDAQKKEFEEAKAYFASAGAAAPPRNVFTGPNASVSQPSTVTHNGQTFGKDDLGMFSLQTGNPNAAIANQAMANGLVPGITPGTWVQPFSQNAYPQPTAASTPPSVTVNVTVQGNVTTQQQLTQTITAAVIGQLDQETYQTV